jgi:hypothetical protein
MALSHHERRVHFDTAHEGINTTGAIRRFMLGDNGSSHAGEKSLRSSILSAVAESGYRYCTNTTLVESLMLIEYRNLQESGDDTGHRTLPP